MSTDHVGLTKHHVDCAYCGHRIDGDAPLRERFGERFCSEAHAEQFAEGVRAARMEAASRPEASGTACSLPPAGQRTWTDYLKRGACWGAPLVLLLAIPLLWSGSAWGAASGSLLSLFAVLACPLGMYFMMRAMSNMSHDRRDGNRDETRRQQE
jgi:hypothetical protein